MSIKLVVLKSGEHVISDVLEWMSGPEEDANLIGYLLNKPCVASLKDNPENEDTYKINLFPWIPLGKDIRIPIPTDHVVTMIDPIDKLLEIYKRDVYSVNKEESNESESEFPEQITATIITPDGVVKQ